MHIDELLTQKRDDILRVAEERGARNVRLFGSAATGQAGPDSDVDLLVDLDPGRSLLDLAGLTADLQALLQTSVDVLTEKGLHWYIRDRVLAGARPL